MTSGHGYRGSFCFQVRQEVAHFPANRCHTSEYEQEWRNTRPLEDPDVFIEEEWVQLYKFPKESVAELILGCRSSKALRQEIETIIRTETAYRTCKLLHAQLDDEQFRLNIMPI